LRHRELDNVQKEFTRALDHVEKDPETGLTAACSILEALFKTYIEDEGLDLPADQSLLPLYKIVRNHLHLDPSAIEDNDIKMILAGLISLVQGIGALRTHASSAHGKGRKRYQIAPRHAGLAIHGAHTVCVFILETWDDRKAKR
jgi:Abortive infection C-terminus